MDYIGLSSALVFGALAGLLVGGRVDQGHLGVTGNTLVGAIGGVICGQFLLVLLIQTLTVHPVAAAAGLANMSSAMAAIGATDTADYAAVLAMMLGAAPSVGMSLLVNAVSGFLGGSVVIVAALHLYDMWHPD